MKEEEMTNELRKILESIENIKENIKVDKKRSSECTVEKVKAARKLSQKLEKILNSDPAYIDLDEDAANGFLTAFMINNRLIRFAKSRDTTVEAMNDCVPFKEEAFEIFDNVVAYISRRFADVEECLDRHIENEDEK